MSLQQLWAGWRQSYVTTAVDEQRRGDGDSCVFCRIAASGPPSVANAVVWRGQRCFCALNAYPYASGHLLVLPQRHVGNLEDLTDDEAAELWHGARTAVTALTGAYQPDGVNLGANLGRAAGAGIPGHLHLHVLPRWDGDTNFMTTVGGVRVMPEDLAVTWQRVVEAWPIR